MIEKDDWKIAIEDARLRHSGTLSLILFTDRQAMGLLRLYVTIGIATASAGLAILFGQSTIPQAAGYGLAAAAVLMVVAAYCCFRAMDSAVINLPGRQAEFWLWAATESVGREDIFKSYLSNLQEKHLLNNRVNEDTARWLRRAKLAGVWSPLVALAVGTAAYWLLTASS